MSKILDITNAMSREEINEAMPFRDFAENALAAVTYDDALAGEVFCELHQVDDASVLFFPATGTALVNKQSTGTGNSVYLEDVRSAEDAAQKWADA